MQQAQDLHLGLLSDEALGLVHDHHGAVAEVADALPFLPAFADDVDFERLTGMHQRFEQAGEFRDADVRHGLQLGDFPQVVVVGEEFRAEHFGQAHELGIDFLFVGEIGLVNFDIELRRALEAAQHLQAAASARLADGIVGIGDQLQFAEHKARHDDDALDKIGLDQVGDPAVDDDAGVEHEEVLRPILRRETDVGNDEREILLVAAHREDDADVAEAEEQTQPDQPAGRLVRGVEQTRAIDHHRDERAQHHGERDGGKGAEGEALHQFIERDQHAAEDQPGDQPKRAVLNHLGAHLADRVAAERAEKQKRDSDLPERHEFQGLCDTTGI